MLGIWVSLAFFVLLLGWPAIHWLARKRRPHGLAVVFDVSNPNGKFWSKESPRDLSGNKQPGIIWEYRVEVKNESAATLRNVHATIEGKGAMPMRQQLAFFDINRSNNLDHLHPGETRMLTVLHWPIPEVQAGMMVGENAYGPITVSVAADDVPTVYKTFSLNYQRTPMLLEALASQT